MTVYPENRAPADLKDLVARIKVKLKKEGDGSYETNEATAELFRILSQSNALDERGEIVFRLGCRVAIVEQSGLGLSSGMRNLSAASADKLLSRRQSDFFSDPLSPWYEEEVALSEGFYAIRKARGDLKFEEAKRAVQLGRKKYEEVRNNVDRLQRIIDRHPRWAQRPHFTLLEIVRGVEAGPVT